MSKAPAQSPPPDRLERRRALDTSRSILVQAPAGSGKTDLLTRRFLRLLAEVDEPGQVVAITFTNAAAAEMRHRILGELEKAANDEGPAVTDDEFSMDVLARHALKHSDALGWNLLDLPAQLRISTIDSFCRDLALQQPLLSGLGGGLAIHEQPEDLYRRAARRTLERIDASDPLLSGAIAALLEWRDNNWQEMEDLLVEMLDQRDRWMHGFVLDREQDWEALRERLERPFATAVREILTRLSRMLDQLPGAREEALELARFACEEPGANSPWGLAECAEIPSAPFSDGLESARDVFSSLSKFLQTLNGTWRSEKGLRAPEGFPPTPRGRAGKARFSSLTGALAAISGLESALAAVRTLPPARYTGDEWKIVKASFTLLRRAAAELQVVFAEAAAVDFIEVAQIAQRVLKGPDDLPTDAAMAVSDGILHLLVDEFQDTSRRQHRLLAGLVAAWPERAGRTCFVVGDPMQSIYFFREADAELFPRVQALGLEIPNDEPLFFDFVPLRANFRTMPSLVGRLNDAFDKVFATPDGSGVTFASAEPMREEKSGPGSSFTLHLDFVPKTGPGKIVDPGAVREKEAAHDKQIDEIVALIRNLQQSNLSVGHPREAGADSLPFSHEAASTGPAVHQGPIQPAHASGEKFRIAVLGRTRNALAPIAQALREAAIPFRAVDLEKLKDRPEVLDALALARALLNPQDRVAWLGVLRAPWCGLALDDLHRLASADDSELLARPVPELLAERLSLLDEKARRSAERVLEALDSVPQLRAALPTASIGTWLEQVWQRLGGAQCVDRTALANLDLLWSCLDRLSAGEQDLLGPALDAALDKLTALPDPAANSDCGVQLMTIHKSKGLEFEVVIVPELQAGSGRGYRKMLSWLERGLTFPDDSGEITEFLVAPFQPKGADRGEAKAWVDRVYRQRESQEDRRILYVAATRAREELHLFARPACKAESDGSFSLSAPSNSLLATAWPALEDELRARFEEWKAAGTASQASQDQVIESIAASGESNLLGMPPLAKPTLLRRLPPDFQPVAPQILGAPSFPCLFAERVGNHAYPRHEGGLLSRALGTAVHALLEELSNLRIKLDWNASREALQRLEPRIAAQVRASGFDQAQAAQIAAQALHHALNASHDLTGQWILSPHTEAVSEVSWAGMVAGSLRTVRVDRVFRAGPAPRSEGEDCWWIVDYKTAHAGGSDFDPATALPELRKIFAPQLEAYAEVLRNLRGKDSLIRAGLYYPRMLLFDWWEL
jgi:ATP-dependent exoDNAse (exonuclease V) beta subunit